MQHPRSAPRHAGSFACTPGATPLWSPRDRHLRATQCLAGLSTPSKELYSILANGHNPLLWLGIAAGINEQEEDRVLNPSPGSWRG